MGWKRTKTTTLFERGCKENLNAWQYCVRPCRTHSWVYIYTENWTSTERRKIWFSKLHCFLGVQNFLWKQSCSKLHELPSCIAKCGWKKEKEKKPQKIHGKLCKNVLKLKTGFLCVSWRLYMYDIFKRIKTKTTQLAHGQRTDCSVL